MTDERVLPDDVARAMGAEAYDPPDEFLPLSHMTTWWASLCTTPYLRHVRGGVDVTYLRIAEDSARRFTPHGALPAAGWRAVFMGEEP